MASTSCLYISFLLILQRLIPYLVTLNSGEFLLPTLTTNFLPPQASLLSEGSKELSSKRRDLVILNKAFRIVPNEVNLPVIQLKLSDYQRGKFCSLSSIQMEYQCGTASRDLTWYFRMILLTLALFTA